MKLWIRLVLLGLLGAAVVTTASAQQPVVSVSITQISVAGSSGGIVNYTVTNGGSGYTSAPTVTVTGGGGAGATATANLTGVVGGFLINSGGSGYSSAPTVNITGGGGSGATATATITGGVVTSVTLVNPGSGYVTAPTVTLTGGNGSGASVTATLDHVVGSITPTSVGAGYTSSPTVTITGGGGAGATATGNVGGVFTTPNEAFGPAGTEIDISALAVGTFPAAGFAYEYFVNGISIGVVDPNPANGTPAIAAWTPPQPGSYFITVKATGGTNSATSLAVRYFATGTAIISPVENTIVPTGSSVVIQATATAAPSGTNAFIQRIDFYADGSLIGSDTTYPYSIIYTPPTTPSSHSIEARAYDNNGNQVSVNGTAVQHLNMATAIGQLPTSSINSPANNTAVAIPDYASDPNAKISVAVDAHSPTGVINKVELYIDGVLFKTSTTYPYSFSWQPLVTGTYKLVALAYDDKNNVIASTTSATSTTTPAPTSVIVAASPTVVVTTPSNGATVTGGSPTQLSANASDSNGSPIVSVQFFDTGTFVGEATTPTPAGSSTYTITYTPTAKTDSSGNPVASTITALAVDQLGLSKLSDGVSVNVTTGGSGGGAVIGIPPTVSLTSPTAGSTLAVNSPVTIAAAANDTDGNVASVQFFVNSLSLGTTTTYPYRVSWTPTSLGTYSVTAKAIDDKGNAVTSSPVTVTVADPGPGSPTVYITSPTNNGSLPVGGATTITATATDDVAVAGVQFYVNGQPLGALDTTFPYSVAWTPPSPGSYTLIARATDNIGNQSTSSTVTVTATAGNSPTVSIINPVSGTSVALGGGVQLIANAADSDGSVTQVQFFANGVPITNGTKTAAPYSVNWVPGGAGAFTVTAVATDNTGNTTTSSPITVNVTSAGAPSVTVTSPANGSAFLVSTSIPLTASAVATSGNITQVEFLVNGVSLSVGGNPDLSAPYSVTWTPTSAGTYAISAIATDSAGRTTISSASTVTIADNQPPTVSLNSPVAGTTVNAGSLVTLVATAADSDGTISSVRFLANGALVGTASSQPYIANWIPTAAGSYSLVAQAADNSGNVTNSAAVTLTVVGNQAPVVSITSPTVGAAVRVGFTTPIIASAVDADGTITSVQFFANGVSLGTDTTSPYSINWTPNSAGIYRLTAVASDNSGAVTTSSTVTVLAADASSVAADTIFTGSYQGLGESGSFSMVNLHGRSATFIGYVPASQTASTAKTYYYSDIPVNGAGSFSLTDSTGKVLITGQFSDTGVSGSIDNGRLSFIGPISAGASSVASGYYTGNVNGHSGSYLVAIVTPLGGITIYDQEGAFSDAGAGTLTSAGYFDITTRAGNRFVGQVDSATGALSGTLTAGSAGGTFSGALGSSSTISDGFLRNLSALGTVTSSDALTAGFVIGGSTPKTILVRAIGPTLSQFGVSNPLPAPHLELYKGSTKIAQYDAWGGSAQFAIASAQVGAFPLPFSSADAMLIASNLAPGSYSARVSGLYGTSGAVLVELYDMDSLSAFSPQKLLDISTLGRVTGGSTILSAGFVVSGTSPKRVLIRGVGPTLSQFSVANPLSDPFIRVYRQNGPLVRENDNWESGNDASLIIDAASSAGAFALTRGSKDAALVLTLQPGVYSVQVSGVNGADGMAIVEVYEVP